MFYSSGFLLVQHAVRCHTEKCAGEMVVCRGDGGVHYEQ